MKEQIQTLILTSIKALQEKNVLSNEAPANIQVDNCKDKSHGDCASNIALVLAKTAKMKPRDLAEKIVANIPETELLAKVDIAGPGFINFTFAKQAFTEVIKTILEQKQQFGLQQLQSPKKINVEFISANPTGPLHVGHGRGAAYGSTISNLFKAVGYQVDQEYYVNDAGRQMDILATSIWLRYLSLLDLQFDFPSNGYKGDYVIDIAKDLLQRHQESFKRNIVDVYFDVPADEVKDEQGKILRGDKEAHIDGLVRNAKLLLADDYDTVFKIGLNWVLNDIKADTKAFGIEFDSWFSEKSLETSNAIQHAIDILKEKNYLYEKDHAIWFKSTKFGDEKDRVVIRDNGQTTYFASDLAYLLNKIERGYDKIIYVFGADHHGYVPRLRAAAKAFGIDDSHIFIPLVQFAILYRGAEKVQMSTRSGEFVTLQQLLSEVGKDACRYFYIMRKVEQHMDFDLELAKSNSKDNPVYYIQYAHARICRVFGRLSQQNLSLDIDLGLAHLSILKNHYENGLISLLNRYPELIKKSAEQIEPHLLANYLKELATALHGYYDASGEKVLVDEATLRNARLVLLMAVKQVLVNGLDLLGISSPEKM